MSEQTFKTITTVTEYLCDDCQMGPVNYYSTFRLGLRTVYVHICPYCNKTIELDKQYPIINCIKKTKE